MKFEDAINKLALAKELEAQAKELKQEVADAILPEMESQELTAYAGPNNDTITYVKPSQTTRLNADQAKAELAGRGVPVSFITASFAAATTTNTRAAYLKYQAPKPKNGR